MSDTGKRLGDGQPRLRFEELQEKARGKWPYIFEDLAPNLHEALQTAPHHVPCPVHGGKDGFRFFKEYAETGAGICNTCGAHREFAMLAWAKGYDFKDAVREVAGWFGGQGMTQPIETRPPIKEIRQADPTVAKARIESAMRESVGVKGTPAEAYLKRRGLSVETLPPVLRAHLSMPYFYGKTKTHYGKHPCLMAPITSANNEKRSIQRIFVTPDGAKADVPDPKYMMTKAGTLNGCAIKLFQAVGDTLGFAEGIETALAAHEISMMPVWATVTAGLMEVVDVPDAVKHIVVWADKDASERGALAALALKKRMEALGKKVSIFFPPMPIDEKHPKGVDWLDVLNEMGEAGFPPDWRRKSKLA